MAKPKIWSQKPIFRSPVRPCIVWSELRAHQFRFSHLYFIGALVSGGLMQFWPWLQHSHGRVHCNYSPVSHLLSTRSITRTQSDNYVYSASAHAWVTTSADFNEGFSHRTHTFSNEVDQISETLKNAHFCTHSLEIDLLHRSIWSMLVLP